MSWIRPGMTWAEAHFESTRRWGRASDVLAGGWAVERGEVKVVGFAVLVRSDPPIEFALRGRMTEVRGEGPTWEAAFEAADRRAAREAAASPSRARRRKRVA